jgi:tetratricopeptide (TPR) repeat protein
MVRRILEGNPPGLFFQEVQSAYAELTQLVGWLLFNLGNYRAARHYYDEARTAAHDAHNVELVTYVLSAMSHLATWQGKPRVGIDHAIAAQSWAVRSGSQVAVAYAADVAARAYAASYEADVTARGHADEDLADSCRAALDTEQEALAQPPSDPSAPWWYFYDESFYRGTTSETALMLQQPARALEAATQALGLIDPANVHNYALTLTLQSDALTRQGQISDACRILGDAARLTAVNSSRRIDQRIMILRRTLASWEDSKPVQELDEKLEIYRPASPEPSSGTTNRS